MSIASRAKALLRQVGLSVSHLPAREGILAADCRPSRDRIVEFAGPSGIGKTHLCQSIRRELKKDWYFERHAKVLADGLSDGGTTEEYIMKLLYMRAEQLRNGSLTGARQAEVIQRMSEVARQGMAARCLKSPRGFVLDDALVHFFCEQIVAQDPEQTREFFRNTSVIFLLPEIEDDEVLRNTEKVALPEVASPNEERRRRVAVYHEARDHLDQLGVSVLTLIRSRGRQTENAVRAIEFIRGVCA